MPLTGHLWPKLECCTTLFPIWGPILDKAGFLVKSGLIWLNMRNLHNTPHISRLKTVSWKVFLFFKRAIPIGNFVGYHPSIILYFWSCWGNLSPWLDSFVYTWSDLVMPLNGHLGPKLDCCKSLFWYQDQILDIYCWVRVAMRLNFTQHGHHCGFIWLNIGNLPNTPHISKLKVVLWKVCLHRPKGDPN